jgi:hypothetical protein
MDHAKNRERYSLKKFSKLYTSNSMDVLVYVADMTLEILYANNRLKAYLGH